MYIQNLVRKGKLRKVPRDVDNLGCWTGEEGLVNHKLCRSLKSCSARVINQSLVDELKMGNCLHPQPSATVWLTWLALCCRGRPARGRAERTGSTAHHTGAAQPATEDPHERALHAAEAAQKPPPGEGAISVSRPTLKPQVNHCSRNSSETTNCVGVVSDWYLVHIIFGRRLR